MIKKTQENMNYVIVKAKVYFLNNVVQERFTNIARMLKKTPNINYKVHITKQD